MNSNHRSAALLLSALSLGCTPSFKDNIDQLGGTAEQRQAIRQELLLAKERAVDPLLAALDDHPRQPCRRHA
jgi:hypothetical protein